MKNSLIAGFGLAALTTVIALSASPEAVSSPPQPLAQTFEVAMDGSSFHFEGGTNPNGAPLDGTPFVIQGYIYPDGVFDAHGPLSGVNADGSAEFPDLVLGTWICRGWHLQDGDALTGPVVATTQIFDFDGSGAGTDTIVTDGIELADFDVPFRRAIIGSTGRLSSLDQEGAECSQVYVGSGLNVSGGFNTEFTFVR